MYITGANGMKNQITFEMNQKHVAHLSQLDATFFFIPKDQEKKPLQIHPQLDKGIDMLQKKMFSAKHNEVHILPTYGFISYEYVVLIGLGDKDDVNKWREAGATAAKTARKHELTSIAVDLTSFENEQIESVMHALTEGFVLGNYQMKSYQLDEKDTASLQRVVYLFKENSQLNLSVVQHAIETSQVFAQGTNYARDLTNLPGNYLIPSSLADEAVKLSDQYGFTCEILKEQEIFKLGMGGLYEVGKGSVHSPRMIVMKYQGLDQWTDVLGLVGKGITFDTGGISLKKSEGMEEMISDMGGAATVMGVMRAVGEIRPKANLIAVIPAAENMPSGSAYKPGDIVTTMSGRTVEVLNTDAEGRIVLADAITYAKQLGADRLVEISTLTGAVLVALGDVATGAVTNDEHFLQRLLEAAEQTGEKVWQLPAYPEYWDMIKSTVADVKNSSGRWAGTITAALFVGTFAEKTPWIHLDIGGTAWLWKERGVNPKGGTGVLVRSLLQMICREQVK